MRSIQNYVQAEKARREELGEDGFSLIELIVVVVILGILAAIAIPVFTGLQHQAEVSSVNSVIANGASQVASDIAQNKTEVEATAALTALGNQSDTPLAFTTGSTYTIDGFCVTTTSTDFTATEIIPSGPGC